MKLRADEILREIVLARDALSATWPSVDAVETFKRHSIAIGSLDAVIDFMTGEQNERLQASLQERKLHNAEKQRKQAEKTMAKADRKAARSAAAALPPVRVQGE
jgi:hypothetical protein